MKVTNTGEQPHFMDMATVLQGMTTTVLLNYLQSAITGTPMAEPSPEIDESAFQDVAGFEVVSPGNSIWLPLHLEPGSYGVVCFVPDKETGVEHAALGMAQVFTVT
jgi:hypothetical protein